MPTKRIVARMLFTGLAAALLVLAGCDAAEDALSSFTGGTSSKDKKDQQEIPSMVKSSATAQPENAPPAPPGEARIAVDAPAPATKGQVTPGAVGTTADAPVHPVTVAQSAPKSLREETQAYTATRYRDPFRSLISSNQDRTDIVDLSVVTLVGVVWAEPSPFCLVEDAEGISYVLRKGDRVKNGRIVAVHRDRLVASQTILGYTTTVQLTLDKEKERTHG